MVVEVEEAIESTNGRITTAHVEHFNIRTC